MTRIDLDSVYATEEAAFDQAKKSARIDYANFETGGRLKLPPLTGKVVWHSGDTQFTIHNPTPGDMAAVHGLAMTRLEVAVDVAPKRSVPADEREMRLYALFDCVVRRVWPFDGEGVQRCYRASSARATSDRLLETVDYGHGEEPAERRLPLAHETFYLGNRHDYTRMNDGTKNWVQVRIYKKTMDDGETLPACEHAIRTEATLSATWLRENGVTRSGDLFGFSFRKRLSKYFRFLEPRVKRFDEFNSGHPGRDRVVNNGLRKLLDRSAALGGVVSWLYEPRVTLDKHQRHTCLCKAFGTALDNLSRLYATSSSIPRPL